VIITMQETNRTDLAKPTDKKMADIAGDLQKKLLQYRLENYHSLHLPKVEGDERLHSRTRDLYQALALPIGSQTEFCEYLVRLFETQQEINREPLSAASAAVLRFLYEWIHLNLTEGRCAQGIDCGSEFRPRTPARDFPAECTRGRARPDFSRLH
jgi:hypothetical protein